MEVHSLDQRRDGAPSRKRKPTSQAAAEERRREKREAKQRRRQAAVERTAGHRDRVLGFGDWCALNGFSETTGWRIRKRGDGPPVVRLSNNRIGIRESDNAAWQASRVR